jgi:hypothetical protein
MAAVIPSAERATDTPNRAPPAASLPVSFPPCCVHVEPLRVKIHAAPVPLSPLPPTIAVLPSAVSATEVPCAAAPIASLPVSLPPCCVHPESSRVKIHAAPVDALSAAPPTMAVRPSAEIATDLPCRWLLPAPPVPTSFASLIHVLPLRTKIQAAPIASRDVALSLEPPTMAVLPSAERATEEPWPALPIAYRPTSFEPCWFQTPLVRVNTHTAPARVSSAMPPTIAVLPSAERAVEKPWNEGATAPVPTSFGPCCTNCAKSDDDSNIVVDASTNNAHRRMATFYGYCGIAV